MTPNAGMTALSGCRWRRSRPSALVRTTTWTRQSPWRTDPSTALGSYAYDADFAELLRVAERLDSGKVVLNRPAFGTEGHVGDSLRPELVVRRSTSAPCR